MMMARVWVVAGGIGGFAGVGLGASTHLTNGDVHAAQLIVTASNFLLFHSLALLAIGALSRKASSRWLVAAGCLFIAGMTMFAGGLTALAIDIGVAAPWIIPVGGSAILLGWLALIVHGGVSGGD